MTRTDSEHYDVVIVGAGMVGASLACALTNDRKSRIKLLLVEASPVFNNSTPHQPGFDTRSTVLSAGTMTYFAQLGLAANLLPIAEPITHIHVSDQGRFGSVQLNAADEGVPALGYVVENANLGRTLNQSLLTADGLELRAPIQVTSIKPCSSGMQLQLSGINNNQSGDGVSENTITTSLVILAEGGRSTLCEQLGISHQHTDYEQSALIANVAFSQPHEGKAFERFTPKGPLALLPLADHDNQHRAALIWTHASENIAGFMAMSDELLLKELQKDFGHRLGTFTRIGKRAVYPLSLQVAHEQIRPALVLLGNVAHSLHPVAGQGFNLALRDAMALAHNVNESIQMGISPGSFTQLQKYLRAVQTDQLHTISFSNYMTRLFSSDNTLLAWVRKSGMASIDLLPPLKHQLSRQAMGLGHARVPRL
ncbi:MAG: 2-octaprenyl-6-methoxyphenyl hydroxylase [Pseudomonadota bacterium]